MREDKKMHFIVSRDSRQLPLLKWMPYIMLGFFRQVEPVTHICHRKGSALCYT